MAIGISATTSAESGHSIGAYATSAKHATAIGPHADALGERSVAIGKDAQAHGTSWVIASGDTSAEVGISGVFGSYTAIPNDQKLAVGGNVPTYTVDALGHGAMVRATGVIVGNSGIVLASNAPTVTTNTLYNDGGTLSFNGSAVGGSSTTNASGAIYQVQYNADGANFGADPSFIFAKNNAAFANPYVLAVSGTIIANSGDANYANPVSIGSGAYVNNDGSIAIGASAEAGNPGVTSPGIAIGQNSMALSSSIIIG